MAQILKPLFVSIRKSPKWEDLPRPMLPFIFKISGILLAVVCIININLIAEENYGLNSPVFFPSPSFVGDRVFYHVELAAPSSAGLSVPEKLPAEKWIEITDVKLTLLRRLQERNVYDLVVTYVAFKPGVIQLPPLPLGDITLRDIDTSTASLLPPTEIARLSPPRGQLLLPGTPGIIAGLAGVYSACFIIIVVAVVFVRKLIVKILFLRKKRIPGIRMKKRLKLLLKSAGKTDDKLFFIGFSDIVKIYLDERLGFPSLSLTTSEIRRFFFSGNFSGGVADTIGGLLEESDLVKFGGKTTGPSYIRSMVERANKIDTLLGERTEHVVD